jgi:hypothetical protein
VGDYSETGIAVLALTVVLAAFKLFDHFMARRNGGKLPIHIECPNKIESLNETIHKIESSVRKTAADSRDAATGVDHLVNQHAPEGGIEHWKIIYKRTATTY